MRASQFIDFINKKEMPSKEEKKIRYTHLDLETLKKVRRKYRQQLRRSNEIHTRR